MVPAGVEGGTGPRGTGILSGRSDLISLCDRPYNPDVRGQRCLPCPGSSVQMAARLLALGLCTIAAASLAQPAGAGERSGLRQDPATGAGSPVRQVLAHVDPQAANSLPELQAAEIEQVLNDSAKGLVSGKLRFDSTVAPDFEGMPLKPATEVLSHSKGGLQAYRGATKTGPRVVYDSLAAEFSGLLSGYPAVHSAAFKVVGIEPRGQHDARASLLFQLAGESRTGEVQQATFEWESDWNQSDEGLAYIGIRNTEEGCHDGERIHRNHRAGRGMACRLLSRNPRGQRTREKQRRRAGELG